MNKVTTATKTVTVLTRYAVKATGSIVYSIRNGGNAMYLVTLNLNGSHVCLQASGLPCPSSKGHTTCYHITECSRRETLRKARENSKSELERIDRETLALIASELQAAQAVQRPESEQKRVASLPFTTPAKNKNREYAPLNGNRPFSLLR